MINFTGTVLDTDKFCGKSKLKKLGPKPSNTGWYRTKTVKISFTFDLDLKIIILT